MTNECIRMYQLCLTSLVSVLFVGCREPDMKRHVEPQPVTLDSLCDELQRLSTEGQHNEISNLLSSVNVEKLAEAELARPDPPRFVALAQDLLLFPGVPAPAELQILENRNFRELPGFGDDAAAGWGDDPALFDAAHEFARRYNSALYKKVSGAFENRH